MTMTGATLLTFFVLLHAAIFVLPFRLVGTSGRFSQQPQQQQQQQQGQQQHHASVYSRLYSSAIKSYELQRPKLSLEIGNGLLELGFIRGQDLSDIELRNSGRRK